MTGSVQLDLFGDRPDLDLPVDGSSATPITPEGLTDEGLIAAIPNATLADVSALTAEAGKRRLNAAIPALSFLCNRFVGYGATGAVPEQVAALHALGALGGREAAHAVAGLITKKVLQGPNLVTALTIAAELGIALPHDVAVALLRDLNSAVRAAACGCVRAGHDVIAALLSLISDPDPEVAIASACALGRVGRPEALGPLKKYLTERPSRRVVEALARVADDEAVVFLARIARARRELTDSVILALDDIENPRALAAAEALKRSTSYSG